MDYQAPLQVPMSAPDLTEAERQAVLEVINTNYLSMGPKIQAFENAMREFIGVKHAIAVSNGTTGLHLCIHAADVKMGDYVITTPFSFVSSTNVILFEKAIPIFVDVDPLTGNIDPNMIAQAAEDLSKGGKAAQRWLPRKGAVNGGKLKAILSVDVFGQPADMDPILETTKHHNLRLIDDSCEALGAEYKNQKIGTLGDYSVFAFYPNKQITTGEGGIIVTDDDNAASLMRSLRNQGRAPQDTWLDHSYLGYNYRLNEMSCALGAAQMERIEELISNRSQVASWYNQALANIPGVEIPVIHKNSTRTSWFVYVIRLAPGLDTNHIAIELKKKGIPVRPYFSPIHLQPYMREMFAYQPGDFPVTENLGKRGLALPFSGIMKKEQVDQVCEVLLNTLSA
ncbi:MAG: DegT/DnrJ/EryC1/StrS family aminotransferase [Anaerolineaceae bacterium]|nr:DegT/DnrJ/EryC1/StrS family aminotransferase [Anaerolineaceae bacterium]